MMRMTFLKPVVLLLTAGINCAAAQTVMDGSDKSLTEAEMQTLQRAMRSVLTDPFGGQLIDLTRVGSGICGKVNAKNKMGGYTGFRLFFADFRAKRLTIEPPEVHLPSNPETLSTKRLLELQSEMGKAIQGIEKIQAGCSSIGKK